MTYYRVRVFKADGRLHRKVGLVGPNASLDWIKVPPGGYVTCQAVVR